MKIIFMGTPEFAIPSLEKLLAEGHKILQVISQPDKPSSRGRKISMPPVKRYALERELPVYQPEKIKSDNFYELLRQLQPEIIVVVAFGRILPARIIYLPARGSVNLHASLLPKYRGAAPINWAIIKGEKETGCTTMLIDEGMDTGDILLKEKVSIEPQENALELSKRLSKIGAELLCQTLKGLEKGNLSPVKQDDSLATYAPMLKKEDGLIDWSLDAISIFNHIRGMFPWPGSYTYFRGSWLKLLRAQPNEEVAINKRPVKPGEIVSLTRDSIIVACGQDSFLSLLQFQPQNRSVMSGRDFINGYRPSVEELLGESSC